jgi:hypothetical protein
MSLWGQVPTTSYIYSGAVGGKTGKTAVLPEFCKIECSGGSGGHIVVVLPGPCVRAAPAAPLHISYVNLRVD